MAASIYVDVEGSSSTGVEVALSMVVSVSVDTVVVIGGPSVVILGCGCGVSSSGSFMSSGPPVSIGSSGACPPSETIGDWLGYELSSSPVPADVVGYASTSVRIGKASDTPIVTSGSSAGKETSSLAVEREPGTFKVDVPPVIGVAGVESVGASISVSCSQGFLGGAATSGAVVPDSEGATKVSSSDGIAGEVLTGDTMGDS